MRPFSSLSMFPRIVEPTVVGVESITYATEGGRNSDKHLLITLKVVDDLGYSVSGASVSIDLKLDGLPYASGTATTGSDGSLTFTRKGAPSGTYTTVVDNVSASGLTWDGATPQNSFVK